MTITGAGDVAFDADRARCGGGANKSAHWSLGVVGVALRHWWRHIAPTTPIFTSSSWLRPMIEGCAPQHRLLEAHSEEFDLSGFYEPSHEGGALLLLDEGA